MPKFRVQIPHLVWYECDVVAKNREEAFRKVFFDEDCDLTFDTTDYEHEQLSPEQIEWHVHSLTSDGRESKLFAEFNKSPEKKS